MSRDKNPPKKATGPAESPSAPVKPGTPSAPVVPPEKNAVVAPLFRRIDWYTLLVTTLLVFIGYVLTLAPDLTLEDSGELAVGSFYAGVPHPPGYPLWTIFTWLFTRLVPISNVAYRVALASAFSASVACGLLALMVSRGSSMIVESIADFKDIPKKFENALCMVSGFVAAMLLGYSGFMWSQAVIVEVYPFSVLSLMGVLICLMRWMYAPTQRKYLYWAAFLFGVCFTNHQTLIVAAMGIEMVMIVTNPRLGRDILITNSAVYVVGIVMRGAGYLPALVSPPDAINMLFVIFNFVGLASIVGSVWLVIKTGKVLTEWKPVLIMGIVWALGVSFYLYMPLSSMTNPPMNWGYARTAEGFKHALARGQYEKTNPTNIIKDPLRFLQQVFMLFEEVTEEFTLVYFLIALLPFVFYFRMQKRERGWLIGLLSIYCCLAFLLLILLNPAPDRQSRSLNRVFFTASHVIIAAFVGYGLTLTGAWISTQFEKVRKILIYAIGVLTVVALVELKFSFSSRLGERVGMSGTKLLSYTFERGFTHGQQFQPIYASLIVAGLCIVLLITVVVARRRVLPGLVLAIFALMPTSSLLSHWADNEQRGHLFGFWFGHDMFTPPFGLYPEMTRNAILFGGTDPGRFCPTYMIFCEGFIPPEKRRDPKFDRRDVYIITQNALADVTYLDYIRAHYNRSTQIDSPFFQLFFHWSALRPLDRFFTDLGAKVEAGRRARGVYPPNEIATPSPDESSRAFNDYLFDAERRQKLGQLKPGEDFLNEGGKLQVSGQVAVMAINALLTKDIFDRNPTNEFFVEESFPLEWMFPYLTPFGVIMKINREVVPELTEEMVKKDHEFWSRYSERLIGNWITYDTPTKEVCDFAEKVYLYRDFDDFKGDPKFIRDDVAQKSFSKLRSSIGGMYAWRAGYLVQVDTPRAYLPNTPEGRSMVLREAEFAFKQSFAYCPFSPEAVYRYIHVLLNMNRLDDAIMVVETCLKLDPQNGGIDGLLKSLKGLKGPQAPTADMQQQAQEVAQLLGIGQTNKALDALDKMVANPAMDSKTLVAAVQEYLQLNASTRMEPALVKLVTLSPTNVEARYDLAGLQAMIGKTNESLENLGLALHMNKARLSKDSKARNLLSDLQVDSRFAGLQKLPEFQKIVQDNR